MIAATAMPKSTTVAPIALIVLSRKLQPSTEKIGSQRGALNGDGGVWDRLPSGLSRAVAQLGSALDWGSKTARRTTLNRVEPLPHFSR